MVPSYSWVNGIVNTGLCASVPLILTFSSPLSLLLPPLLAPPPFVSHLPLCPAGIPREEIFFIDIILFSFMSALAGVGVLLTLVCLLFNLIFMRKK